jgi:16S rRNA (cytidine1402-2'-O)-methyltransferase
MGTLYLIATPIGNLEDITARAVRLLRAVPLIAAEDTRHTRKLLNHLGITTPALSYHEHNKLARLDRVLAALAAGDVALVSDAGTPALSDPGQELVRAAIAAGFPVVPVPGAAAAIAALVASGLATDRFTFLGFLPRQPRARRALLATVRDSPCTLILYEAPHRLRACLADLLAVLGDRPTAAARELTKLHEEIVRGPLSELQARYAAEPGPRGEFTLIVAGAVAGADEARVSGVAEPDITDRATREALARARAAELRAAGHSTRDIAAQLAREFGLPRRAMYQLAMAATLPN